MNTQPTKKECPNSKSDILFYLMMMATSWRPEEIVLLLRCHCVRLKSKKATKMVAVISLNEIVRFARDEIRVSTDEICFADEIKSTHRRSDFTRAKRGFHIAMQYFTHPQGWI